MTSGAPPDDFARWYAEVAVPVNRRVAAAVGDRLLAREASAEAFARAFERWERVRCLDAPEAWVVTVAVNACRRWWRRRALEARALERLDGLRSPHHDVELVDETLHALVDDLPERMRTAVKLRYWHGLTEREVADEMRVARGTASAMLSQARRRLVDRIDPEGAR